jgi:hypothetical protein
MKNKTFLLIMSIYGLLLGGIMLFNASGTMRDYGIQNIDSYHISIFQYLGLSDIGFSFVGLLIYKNGESASIRAMLFALVFVAISAVLKGYYDVFVVGLPSTTYFWIDSTLRLMIGLVSLYFAMRKEKQ